MAFNEIRSINYKHNHYLLYIDDRYNTANKVDVMHYLDDLSIKQVVIPEDFKEVFVKKKRRPSKSINEALLTKKQKQIELEDYMGSTVSDQDFYDRYGQSAI